MGKELKSLFLNKLQYKIRYSVGKKIVFKILEIDTGF